MTEKERQHLEERLQTERAKALRAIRRAEDDEYSGPAEAAGDVSRFPTHLADGGSNTQEEEMDFLTAARESDLLNRINEALQLLYQDPDRYATCQNCSQKIEFERLDVVPWTRLCSECAASEEAGGA